MKGAAAPFVMDDIYGWWLAVVLLDGVHQQSGVECCVHLHYIKDANATSKRATL